MFSLCDVVIQRIDVASQAIAMEARIPGETLLLIFSSAPRLLFILSTSERQAQWGVERLPMPSVAAPDLTPARLLACSLEHGIVLQCDARIVAFRIRGQQIHRELLVAMPPSVFLLAPLSELHADAVIHAATLTSIAVARAREHAIVTLRRTVARLQKRAAAIASDLDRIRDAERLAQQCTWLVATAAKAPRGARELVSTDWSTGEPTEIRFTLDPSKPATVQLQALFLRAKRLAHGASIAVERQAHAASMLASMVLAKGELEHCTSIAEIELVLGAVTARFPENACMGRSNNAGSSGKHEPHAALPYRVFHGFGDGLIWVGKGASQNDILTFKVAKPFDLWLHVKNHRGAHVIVQRKRGQDCPSELLIDAALLAAHFSEARDETMIEVQYTQRGQVRKPRKSVAGLVVVRTEKVLLLRTSEPRLRQLLAGEKLNG